LAAFERFADYLGDDEASAGLVKCGYLIAAPEGPGWRRCGGAGAAAGEGIRCTARRPAGQPSGCRSPASTTRR
jgi:hypothetical protein